MKLRGSKRDRQIQRALAASQAHHKNSPTLRKLRGMRVGVNAAPASNRGSGSTQVERHSSPGRSFRSAESSSSSRSSSRSSRSVLSSQASSFLSDAEEGDEDDEDDGDDDDDDEDDDHDVGGDENSSNHDDTRNKSARKKIISSAGAPSSSTTTSERPSSSRKHREQEQKEKILRRRQNEKQRFVPNRNKRLRSLPRFRNASTSPFARRNQQDSHRGARSSSQHQTTALTVSKPLWVDVVKLVTTATLNASKKRTKRRSEGSSSRWSASDDNDSSASFPSSREDSNSSSVSSYSKKDDSISSSSTRCASDSSSTRQQKQRKIEAKVNVLRRMLQHRRGRKQRGASNGGSRNMVSEMAVVKETEEVSNDEEQPNESREEKEKDATSAPRSGDLVEHGDLKEAETGLTATTTVGHDVGQVSDLADDFGNDDDGSCLTALLGKSGTNNSLEWSGLGDLASTYDDDQTIQGDTSRLNKHQSSFHSGNEVESQQTSVTRVRDNRTRTRNNTTKSIQNGLGMSERIGSENSSDIWLGLTVFETEEEREQRSVRSTTKENGARKKKKRTSSFSTENQNMDNKANDIWTACKIGDEEFVRRSLLETPQIIFDQRHGRTALYYACHCGHDKIVRLLLEAGAEDDDGTSYQIALDDECRSMLKKEKKRKKKKKKQKQEQPLELQLQNKFAEQGAVLIDSFPLKVEDQGDDGIQSSNAREIPEEIQKISPAPEDLVDHNPFDSMPPFDSTPQSCLKKKTRVGKNKKKYESLGLVKSQSAETASHGVIGLPRIRSASAAFVVGKNLRSKSGSYEDEEELQLLEEILIQKSSDRSLLHHDMQDVDDEPTFKKLHKTLSMKRRRSDDLHLRKSPFSVAVPKRMSRSAYARLTGNSLADDHIDVKDLEDGIKRLEKILTRLPSKKKTSADERNESSGESATRSPVNEESDSPIISAASEKENLPGSAAANNATKAVTSSSKRTDAASKFPAKYASDVAGDEQVKCNPSIADPIPKSSSEKLFPAEDSTTIDKEKSPLSTAEITEKQRPEEEGQPAGATSGDTSVLVKVEADPTRSSGNEKIEKIDDAISVAEHVANRGSGANAPVQKPDPPRDGTVKPDPPVAVAVALGPRPKAKEPVTRGEIMSKDKAITPPPTPAEPMVEKSDSPAVDAKASQKLKKRKLKGRTTPPLTPETAFDQATSPSSETKQTDRSKRRALKGVISAVKSVFRPGEEKKSPKTTKRSSRKESQKGQQSASPEPNIERSSSAADDEDEDDEVKQQMGELTTNAKSMPPVSADKASDDIASVNSTEPETGRLSAPLDENTKGGKSVSPSCSATKEIAAPIPSENDSPGTRAASKGEGAVGGRENHCVEEKVGTLEETIRGMPIFELLPNRTSIQAEAPMYTVSAGDKASKTPMETRQARRDTDTDEPDENSVVVAITDSSEENLTSGVTTAVEAVYRSEARTETETSTAKTTIEVVEGIFVTPETTMTSASSSNYGQQQLVATSSSDWQQQLVTISSSDYAEQHFSAFCANVEGAIVPDNVYHSFDYYSEENCSNYGSSYGSSSRSFDEDAADRVGRMLDDVVAQAERKGVELLRRKKVWTKWRPVPWSENKSGVEHQHQRDDDRDDDQSRSTVSYEESMGSENYAVVTTSCGEEQSKKYRQREMGFEVIFRSDVKGVKGEDVETVPSERIENETNDCAGDSAVEIVSTSSLRKGKDDWRRRGPTAGSSGDLRRRSVSDSTSLYSLSESQKDTLGMIACCQAPQPL